MPLGVVKLEIAVFAKQLPPIDVTFAPIVTLSRAVQFSK